MFTEADRYDEMNAEAAFTDAHEQAGTKPYNLDNKQDRHKWMAERLADDTPEPDPERSYDLDDRSQRIAYMNERLNGTEFEDVDVSAG